MCIRDSCGVMAAVFGVAEMLHQSSHGEWFRDYLLYIGIDVYKRQLGKTLTKEHMQMAFSVMQESFVPFEATITESCLTSSGLPTFILSVRILSDSIQFTGLFSLWHLTFHFLSRYSDILGSYRVTAR